MTKEEIFNKHSFSAVGAISTSKHFCLSAMDEYAKQQAIAFHQWTQDNKYELCWDAAYNRLYTDTANNWYSPEYIYNKFIELQTENK